MTYSEVMKRLKELGTEQNVKIYKRHGMSEPLFGVSFANLTLLKKQIKFDHALAQKLWKSGNADARNLATMIAVPAEFTSAEIDDWVEDQNSYGSCDLLAKVIGQTPFVKKKAEAWIKSPDEWISRTGWNLIAVLAMDGADPTSDSYFEKLLDKIEKQIHKAKNFTRHAMNNAVIAIGTRNAALKVQAQAAARRIGKVEVDHGETDCKTPDAYAYIEKAFAHFDARRSKSRVKPAGTRKSAK